MLDDVWQSPGEVGEGTLMILGECECWNQLSLGCSEHSGGTQARTGGGGGAVLR